MHPEYPDLDANYRLSEKESLDIPAQPLTPEWEFPILDVQLTGPDLERFNRDLEEVILGINDRIMNHSKPSLRTQENNADTGLRSTRKDWNLFYVNHPAVECLFYVFKQAHDEFIKRVGMTPGMRTSIHCWANVLEFGESIAGHSHQDSVGASYMSANYCVNATDDTATVYDLPGFNDNTLTIPNRPGQLTLFPQWITHWSTEFRRGEDNRRVTVSANIDMGGISEHRYDREHDKEIHYLPFNQPPHEKARRKSKQVSDMPGVSSQVMEFLNMPLDDIRDNDLVFEFGRN